MSLKKKTTHLIIKILFFMEFLNFCEETPNYLFIMSAVL